MFVCTLAAGCTGTDMVDEDPGPVVDARVEIDSDDAVLLAGEQIEFTARYFDTSDMETEASFAWTSSAPSVASVDDGTVTAVAQGQAQITASANGVTSKPVIVRVAQDENSVATIIVSPDDASTSAQGQVFFSAEAHDISDGAVQATFTWSVSDESVASIDGAGIATGLAVGTTEVTATASGITSDPVVLTVEGESRTGVFQGSAGTSYSASGTVVLREVPGGGLSLEFNDDFTVDSGPGLEVFLSTTAGITSESVNIGALQSESGSQSYQVPGGVTLDSHGFVVIHCVPFNVTFASAALN
jgi:hypothetical protein